MAEEIPPQHWNRDRLKEVDAFGADKTGSEKALKSTLNLNEPIHPFFYKAQWVKSDKHPRGIAENRYEALQHSFHIATKLLGLRAVRAFMATFVAFGQEGDIARYEERGRCVPRLSAKSSVDPKIVARFERNLEPLLKGVFWSEDSEMLKDVEKRISGFMVIGHPYTGRFGDGQFMWQIQRWDAKFEAENLPIRLTTVAIASQIIDAIIAHEEGTRAWTRAVFWAALTMVHELAHVAYWHSFHTDFDDGEVGAENEPCFYKDVEAELGNALIATIFSGWVIQPISMNDGVFPPLGKKRHEDMIGFQESGFYWVKHPRIGDIGVTRHPKSRRYLPPQNRTCYSIPFEDIEKYTQSQFWNGSSEMDDRVLDRFRPSLPFQPDRHTRRASHKDGGVVAPPYEDPFWITLQIPDPLKANVPYKSPQAPRPTQAPVPYEAPRAPVFQSSRDMMPANNADEIVQIDLDEEEGILFDEDDIYAEMGSYRAPRLPRVPSSPEFQSSRDMMPANNADEIVQIDLDEEEGILFDEDDIYAEMGSYRAPRLPRVPSSPEFQSSTYDRRGGLNAPRFIDVEPPGTNWAQRPHSMMPPETWQRDDLIRTGAIDVNFHHESDLLPLNVHPFFHRKAWTNVSDERYNALQPAFQLASRLIQLSTEYYTTFLPFSNFKTKPSWKSDSFAFAPDMCVVVNENPSTREMEAAQLALSDIAENIAWLEDSYIFTRDKQFGLTNCGSPASYAPIPRHEWDQDAIAQGKKTRPLIIKIATQFADSMSDAEPGSARQLIATLCCAITLVHEIGHAIFYANFEQKAQMGTMELWVGDDAQLEFGVSMIGWLFGGWEPGVMHMAMGTDFEGSAFERQELAASRFETHMAWQKVDKWVTQRLFWNTDYSIPLSFIKKIFTERNWLEAIRGAAEQNSPLETVRYIRRTLLHPTIPFDPATHSRRLHRMFSQKADRFILNNRGDRSWLERAFQRGAPLRLGIGYNKNERQDAGDDDEEFGPEPTKGQFQPQNPDTYPYIDPYFDDGYQAADYQEAEAVSTEDDGLTATKPMRYGVELEMVFAFNLPLLRAIQRKFSKEHPEEIVHQSRKFFGNLPYDQRNKEPFNPWGLELPYRAYNSFAVEGDAKGTPMPYTYEIPYMLAECLLYHPDVDFEIKFHDEAAESHKNRDRYRTWTVLPDLSVRGIGSENVSTWLPHIFTPEMKGLLGPDSFGMEVVSRVLNTADAKGLEELKAVCTALTKPVHFPSKRHPLLHGAFVTNATALHVHVEAPNLQTLKNLAYLVIIFEDEISRLHPLCQQKEHFTAKNSLETNREYFLSRRGLAPLSDIRKTIFSEYGQRPSNRGRGPLSVVDVIDIMNPGKVGRHRLVNFAYANRFNDTKTVEFRSHRGTLDFNEIKWWIEFVTRFVCLAGRKDEETVNKLKFRDWADWKINIFYLFDMMEFPEDGINFYKGRMARYMDYPLNGELNAWHLELPPGSKEPGYGPPYPNLRSGGSSGGNRPSGPGGNNPRGDDDDSDDDDQGGYGSGRAVVAPPSAIGGKGKRGRRDYDDDEDEPGAKKTVTGARTTNPGRTAATGTTSATQTTAPSGQGALDRFLVKSMTSEEDEEWRKKALEVEEEEKPELTEAQKRWYYDMNKRSWEEEQRQKQREREVREAERYFRRHGHLP